MRYKVVVKYNGARYFGWQKQVGLPSVQEEIENALSTIFTIPTTISGSGRTDAKVHALGQVFHFDAKMFSCAKLKLALNRMLPPDIEILKVTKVSDDFHARHSAKSKQYQYVLNKNAKDPFMYEQEVFYPYPLDEKLLNKVIKDFIGVHSFCNFTNRSEDEQNFVREITKAWITSDENNMYINFIGNGFMRSQIRIMVGVLLAINEGRENLGFIKENLNPAVRKITNYKVSGAGLYLVNVKY